MDMETNFDNQAHVVALPQYTRPRHVPDVPQDVDFLMEHLNDPNYDLRNRSKSTVVSSYSLDVKRREDLSDDFTGKHDFSTKSTDLDSESQAESTRYSTTSMSDFTDFDEYVTFPRF